jgi:hypothetical protein
LTTQTNTIINRYKSEGANKVVKDTERVGRAQTRLGQASASSGRQFAAQASGLGGLVAAYAGAAATVFALTAAFDALNKAARAEEIVRGTKALALEVGLNGQRILDNVQKITQGQLALVEAAEQVNIAFAAGFDQRQIEGLTEVSLKASRALGRNLADAFTRITRGAAKLEPELLDELGIFVRIDPAVERYANKLNIAASQLTNFERRQAFVNAIIDEGNEKFEAIGTSAPTTQKSLEQLQATIQNLAASFGQFIANTLQPIVDYFNNNFNNAILLFVGILTLVFGKATQLISSFVSTSLNNLGGFADRLQDKAIIPLQKIQQTQASLLKDIGEGGLKGIRLKPQIGQDPAQAQRFAQALSLQRTEQELSASQIQKINRAYKEQVKFLEATGKTGSATYKNLKNALEENNKLVEEGGRRVKVFGGISNFASKAVAGLSIAIGKLGAVLNGLFVISAVFQLVGVDVIGLVKKLFAGAEATENFKLGLVGVVQASSLGSRTLKEFAKGIGLNKDEIEKLDEKIISVNKNLTTIGRERLRNEQLRLSNKLALTEAETNRVLEIRRQLQSGNLSTETRLIALADKKYNVQIRLNEAIKDGNSDLISQLKLEQEIIRRIEESISRFGQDLNQLVGSISSATGIASNVVADLFAGGFIANVDAATGAVTVLGESLVDTNRDGVITFEEQTDSVQKFTSAAFIAGATVEKAEDAFARGATTSDKLSAQIGGIASQLTEIQKSGLGSSEEIEKLTDRLNELTKLRDRLRTVELIGKGISKAFGGEIGAIDTAIFKGLVNITGDLAKNSNEIAKNQTRFLFETLRTTAIAAQNVRIYEKINETIAETGQFIAEDGTVLTQQIKINAVLQEQSANNAKAAKALAGSVFEIFQNTQKIIEAEKIRTVQLQNQIDKLREQTELLQLQNQLAQDQAIQKAQIEALERSVDIDEKRFDLAKQITKANEDQFTAQKSLNDLKSQELQIQRDIADIQFKSQLSQAEAARGTESAQLASSVSRQLEDPRTTAREAFELRKSLLDLERAQADDIQREQAELAERTYRNELAVIGARKVQLLTELDNLETKTQQAEIATLREKELLDQRQAIEIQKINNERDLLKQRFDIDNKTAANAIDDIDRREDLFEAQNAANLAQVESFNVFLKAVQALNEGEFSRALQAYLTEVEGITIETDDFAKQLIADAETSLKTASNLLTSNAALQGEIFDAERTNATSKLAQIGNIFAIEDQALANKLADTETLQKIERDALAQTQLARLAEIEAQRKQIEQQLSNEDLLGQKAYEQLQAKLLGLDIERAATEDALDLRLQSLKDEYDVIRQLNLEIAGIVKSNLTDAFMDLNTAFIEGTLTFKGVADGFRDLLGSMLREIQAAVFRQTIVDPLVGSIVKAVPVFGTSAASGGRIEKKASGGLLRDRVPALLEPGEFVVSRRGAKAIGLANLQEINSGISDDAESILLASLFSKKVKGMASGGKMTQEQLVAAQIKRERALKSQRPTSTVKDLEGFGLGSEGTDFMNLIPGAFFAKTLSQAFGFEMPSFVIGKTAAPLPDTPMKDEQLENIMKNLESKIGVRPTRTKGSIPGAVDPVTGGIFNSAGQAVTIDPFGRMGAALGPNNIPSYTSLGAAFTAVMTPGNMAPLQGSIPGGPTAPVQVGGLGSGGSKYGGILGTADGESYGGYAGASAGSDGFSNAPRASGGMITRMASGGMMRDRVPALLEPGEFVIRRPAAKAIGGAALGAMNATGKATPNIAVNVNNQGVPKNVSVAPPKINGDKDYS